MILKFPKSRHNIKKLDGGGISDKGHLGPIMTILNDQEKLAKMPVAKGWRARNKFPGVVELPEKVFKTLNWDLKILYLLCLSLRDGKLAKKFLSYVVLGPMEESRWFNPVSMFPLLLLTIN